MEEQAITQKIKDQTFISTVAWVILIFALIALYWSVVYLGMLEFIAGTQEQMFSEMGDNRLDDFTTRIQTVQQQSYWTIAISALGSLMLIFTAIAVLKRRRWGRILMTISSVVLVVTSLFLLFYIGRQSYSATAAVIPRMQGVEDPFFQDIQKGIKLQYLSYGIFMLLVCWALVRVIIKLNRPRIRALFS